MKKLSAAACAHLSMMLGLFSLIDAHSIESSLASALYDHAVLPMMAALFGGAALYLGLGVIEDAFKGGEKERIPVMPNLSPDPHEHVRTGGFHPEDRERLETIGVHLAHDGHGHGHHGH